MSLTSTLAETVVVMLARLATLSKSAVKRIRSTLEQAVFDVRDLENTALMSRKGDGRRLNALSPQLDLCPLSQIQMGTVCRLNRNR